MYIHLYSFFSSRTPHDHRRAPAAPHRPDRPSPLAHRRHRRRCDGCSRAPRISGASADHPGVGRGSDHRHHGISLGARLGRRHAVARPGWIARCSVGGRGVLAPMFAQRAGWGDILAAVIALGFVAFAQSPARPKLAFNLWNLFGLLDLAVAVSTAAWVSRQALVPGVEPLVRLPLILVPLFFVPVLAASHIVLFRRINAR